MRSKITFWVEKDGTCLGYLNDYPDHWTQGENFEDLVEHLEDLNREFGKSDLPGIRRICADLADTPESIPPPSWHKEVLINRERKIFEGKSKFHEFAEAQRALQERIQ